MAGGVAQLRLKNIGLDGVTCCFYCILEFKAFLSRLLELKQDNLDLIGFYQLNN
jgi:hypothetical protein